MINFILLSVLVFGSNVFACGENKENCLLPPEVNIAISHEIANYRNYKFDFTLTKTRNPIPTGKGDRFDLACTLYINNAEVSNPDCADKNEAKSVVSYSFPSDGNFKVKAISCVKGKPKLCNSVEKNITVGSCVTPSISFNTTQVNLNETDFGTQICAKSCKPFAANTLILLDVNGSARRTVDYDLSDDYLNFDSGSDTACVDLTIKDDNANEGDENIQIKPNELSLLENNVRIVSGSDLVTVLIADNEATSAPCDGEPEINPPHPTCFVSSNSFVSPTKVSCDSRDAQICSGSGIGTLGLGIVQIHGTPKVINSQLDPGDGIISVAGNAVILNSVISGTASFADNSQFLNSEVIALPAKGIGEKAIRGVVIEGNVLVEDSTIDDNATVSDNAIIKNCFLSDNAIAKESARLTGIGDTNTVCSVSENAIVSGSANLLGSFEIFGDAKVSGNVILTSTDEIGTQWSIWGNAEVSGNVQLIGKGIIAENSKVFDDAVLRPDKNGIGPQIRQNARVFENAVIEGSVIAGQTRVRSKATVAKSVLCFDETIVFNTALKVRCDPNTLPNPIPLYEYLRD